MAETVLEACKKTLQLITARSKNSLKSWQFDRGGELLNQLFEDWILRELGALQLFSNVEHPWENGRAERFFSTIFLKARAMLKYSAEWNLGKSSHACCLSKEQMPFNENQFFVTTTVQNRRGNRLH
jgi:hypothetical protein